MDLIRCSIRHATFSIDWACCRIGENQHFFRIKEAFMVMALNGFRGHAHPMSSSRVASACVPRHARPALRNDRPSSVVM
jgi:hypothetical protein